MQVLKANRTTERLYSEHKERAEYQARARADAAVSAYVQAQLDYQQARLEASRRQGFCIVCHSEWAQRQHPNVPTTERLYCPRCFAGVRTLLGYGD